MRQGLFVLPPAGGGERRQRGRVGGRSSSQVPGRGGPAEPSPGPVTKSRGAQPRPGPPRPGAGRVRLWHAAPPAGPCGSRVRSSATFCPVLSRPVLAALRLPAWLLLRGCRGSSTRNGSSWGESLISSILCCCSKSCTPRSLRDEGSVRARRSSVAMCAWNTSHLPLAQEMNLNTTREEVSSLNK